MKKRYTTKVPYTVYHKAKSFKKEMGNIPICSLGVVVDRKKIKIT